MHSNITIRYSKYLIKMPRREQYESNNPFESPEPHAKPGYTGFFPESGPKRNFQIGKTYEQWTHEVVIPHPVSGLRFGIILSTDESLQSKLGDEVMAWKHKRMTQNPRFGRNMVAGYTGHIPRKRDTIGKTYSEECKTATALFEKSRLLDK